MNDVDACDGPYTNEYVKKAKENISRKFRVNRYSDSALEDRHRRHSQVLFPTKQL